MDTARWQKRLMSAQKAISDLGHGSIRPDDNAADAFCCCKREKLPQHILRPSSVHLQTCNAVTP
jgi:hypothetical protein